MLVILKYFPLQFVDLSSAVAMSFSEAETEKSTAAITNKTSSNIVSKPPTLIQAPLGKTPGAATSLINRTAETIGASSGATTLMVLTTSSAATANHNGAVGMVSSGNTGTLAVKTATTAGAMGGAKTIVVMPVSNNFAAGDGTTAKRFKIE